MCVSSVFSDTVSWIHSALWLLIYNSREAEQLERNKAFCLRINYPWMYKITIQTTWLPVVNSFDLSSKSLKLRWIYCTWKALEQKAQTLRSCVICRIDTVQITTITPSPSLFYRGNTFTWVLMRFILLWSFIPILISHVRIHHWAFWPKISYNKMLLSKYCLTPTHFSLSNYQLLVGDNCESSVDGQGSLLLTASLFSMN